MRRQISELSGHENVNGLYTDYLAELYAAGLLDNGFDLDDIYILRKGGNLRGVSKDIDSVRPTYSQEVTVPSIQIRTNRNSIYDAMPESMFHTSTVSGKGRNKEVAISEIKRHREEEEQLRKFFRLFEVELDRTLILLSLNELHFDKKYMFNDFVETFSEYWPFLKKLDVHSAVLFLSIAPHIYRIRNSYEEVASALSLVLGVEARIEREVGRSCYKFANNKLSGMKLGRNSVTSGNLDDRSEDIKIVLGPVSPEKIVWFVTPGEGEVVVDAMMNMLIDAATNYRIKLEAHERDKHFSFGSEKRMFLGINTKFKSYESGKH